MPTNSDPAPNAGQIQVSTEQLVNMLLGSVNSLRESILQLQTENAGLRSQFQKEADVLRNSVTQLRTENNGLLDQLQSENNAVNARISELQQDNIALREYVKDNDQQLALLQQNLGVRFPLFSKLPAELRRIIWQYACRIPQIHIIGDKNASRSEINCVMSACKEARTVAVSLQLDSFTISYEPYSSSWKKKIHGHFRNYLNLHIDTIWFVRQEGDCYLVPEDLEWRCGPCNKPRYYNARECFAAHHALNQWQGPRFLARLAMNYPAWLLALKEDLIPTINNIKKFGVSELLLVVGNFETLDMVRDFTFVTPYQRPFNTRHTIQKAEAYSNSHANSTRWSVKWCDLVSEIESFLLGYKASQLSEKKALIDAGDVHPVGIDPATWSLWENLESWEIPEIRFVEAIKEPGQWVGRPMPERW